jgi:hypothetical protein
MDADGLYLAGHRAPPGRYARLGAVGGRAILLAEADVLPASLDGTVAAYRRLADAPPAPTPRSADGAPRRRRSATA